MDVGAELLRLRKDLERLERASRLSHASLENTAIQVNDSNGGLRAIVGVQADGTTGVNIVNGGPPPTPSTPTVSSGLGGLAVGWDGASATGAVIPLDWSRVEVHVSPTAGFTPTTATLRATIETPQGGICYIPVTGASYVCLLARNTSGTASPATPVVGPYSPRPVAGDIGIGEIINTMIADGAVTTPKLYANAVTAAKIQAGSVDATALSADAITGKTITGGTITGTSITGSTLTATGSGEAIIAGPTSNPQVRIGSASTFGYVRFPTGSPTENYTATLLGVVQNSGAANENLAVQLQGPAETSATERLTLMLSSQNKDNSFNTNLSLYHSVRGAITYIDKDRTTFYQRLSIGVTTPSALSGLYVAIPAGHTGNLIQGASDSVEKFTVDKDGNTTIAGTLTIAGDATTSGRIKPAGSESGNLTLQNGWTNYSTSTYGTAQVRKTADGMAYLVGRLNSGTATAGTRVATIPTGFWPSIRHAFPWRTPQATGNCSLLVNELGELLIYDITGTINNVSLSGITWPLY